MLALCILVRLLGVSSIFFGFYVLKVKNGIILYLLFPALALRVGLSFIRTKYCFAVCEPTVVQIQLLASLACDWASKKTEYTLT